VSQQPEIDFHVVGPEGIDGILEMMAEFYDYAHIRYDPAVAPAALAELLGDPRLGIVWRIERSGAAIGYAAVAFGFSLELGGRDAILDELYVRQAFRGIGVGRRALEVVEAGCRERGVVVLHLEVDETDERAQRFYANAGYRSRLADTRNYLMTKRLNRA